MRPSLFSRAPTGLSRPPHRRDDRNGPRVHPAGLFRQTRVLLALLGLCGALVSASGGAASPSAPSSAAGSRPAQNLARYTLQQALAAALARNPSALTAEQEIARAEALVRQVRASWFPTLTGNAVGTQLDAARRINERILQNAQALSANAILAVPLAAPQRWLQWSHARQDARISQLGARDLRRTLALAVGHAYLAVLVQRRRLEVDERAVRTAQAHHEFAHRRRVGGVGTSLDEVRAEQEVETTRAQAALSQAALLRAQEALGVLVARDRPVDVMSEVALDAPLPTVEAALREAPSQRSDVALQRSRVAAAARVARDSYADFLPLLTAQFQPFFQEPPTVTLPRFGWQAQLILSLPFYDGGLRYGLRRERNALEAQARIALEGTLRQVDSEVRTAFEALTRADTALRASQRAASLAERALELANTAYRAGATTNLEVIDAERRARDAETAAALAEDNARQARIDLLAASGRFP